MAEQISNTLILDPAVANDWAEIQKYISFTNQKDDATLQALLRGIQYDSIEPLLGHDLYHDLIDEIDTPGSSTTGTANISALLPFIYPVLAHHMAAEWVLYGHINLDRAGARVSSNDEITQARTDQHQKKAAHHRGKAQLFQVKLKNFLEDNARNYSLYSPDTKNQETTTPRFSSLRL